MVVLGHLAVLNSALDFWPGRNSTSLVAQFTSARLATNASTTVLNANSNKNVQQISRSTVVNDRTSSKKSSVLTASYVHVGPAGVMVKPSVLRCVCNGKEDDPPCCVVIRKTESIIKPTTRPIVVPLPVPITIPGNDVTTTVTQNVWKTITDTKYFTKEMRESCTSTVVDFETQKVGKGYGINPTGFELPHKPQGGVHIHEPQDKDPSHDHGYAHDGPINRPGVINIPDGCPRGYLCQPDFGYCHQSCSDYFKGCWEEQCKADFLRCYDNCYIRHDEDGDRSHHGRVYRNEDCHRACTSSDWKCHKNCNQKGTLVSRDLERVQYYPHDKIKSTGHCEWECRHAPVNDKCYDKCDHHWLVNPPQHHQSICAKGYSCRKDKGKIPIINWPPRPELPKFNPRPPPPEQSKQYPPFPSPPPAVEYPSHPADAPSAPASPTPIAPTPMPPASTPQVFIPPRHRCTGKVYCHRPNIGNNTAVVSKSLGVGNNERIMKGFLTLMVIFVCSVVVWMIEYFR